MRFFATQQTQWTNSSYNYNCAGLCWVAKKTATQPTLLKVISEQYQRPIFLGRSKERELIEDVINPTDGRKKPKMFVVFGLHGIGRRSLIKNCVNDLFSLEKTIDIEIEPGDNANSLCIKLADKVEPYSCQKELQDIVNEIKLLSEQEAIDRALYNVERLIEAHEMPLFIDAGGCLNDHGIFNRFLNDFIKSSYNYKSAYFIFILTRRISKDNDNIIDCVPVEQLSKKSISQLLSELSYRFECKISPDQILELTDYINGYPPSAHYAVKQASIYGIDALISDKRTLTQFSKKRFVSHIEEQNLDDSDKTALKILATFSPLPLSSLIALYDCPENEAHDKIYKLIDCSLMRVENGQYYKIADPIKGSVRDVFGNINNSDLEKIITPLECYIKNIDHEKKLEFSRVLFRIAFTLNNEEAKSYGIKLKGDFIKLLEQAYHQQQYKEAVEIGYEAVFECPEDTSARTFLIKAMIQEEMYEQAEKQIDNLFSVMEKKNIYYLQGFLERKKGNIPKAIEVFSNSEKHGRKGLGLQRELAHCYIISGNFDTARIYIKNALNIRSDNNYIIDMAAKLEILSGNEVEAKKYIDQLELVEQNKFFHMRSSSFHLRFGRTEEALKHAEQSVKFGGDRFLAGRIQEINCLIACPEMQEEADIKISLLDTDYPNKIRDVKISLKCKLSIYKKKYKDCLNLAKSFSSSASKQAKGFKKICLMELIKNMSLPYQKRQEYKKELDTLSTVDTSNILDIELML